MESPESTTREPSVEGCFGGCSLQLLLLFGLGFAIDYYGEGSLGFWLTAPMAAAVPIVVMRTYFADSGRNNWVANVLAPLWAAATMLGLLYLWFLSGQ